jgi:putative hydrolase of the HAD superfamily
MSFKYFFIFLFSLSLVSLNALSQSAGPKCKIKAVVFDFSGVIMSKNVPQIAQFTAQSFGATQTEAFEAFKQLKEYESKGGNEEQFWSDYAQSKHKKLPPDWFDQLNKVRIEAISEIPGMTNLVKDLQRQGFRTPLLSNGKRQTQVKQELGYYSLFHPVILSSKLRMKKPDPEIYQVLLKELKLKPGEILFVDNKKENVDTAKALGMDGIVFFDTQQLIQELKKRGIEIKP